MTEERRDRSDEEPKVVIRDRRRIDPVTGAARSSGAGARAAGAISAARAGAGASAARASEKRSEKNAPAKTEKSEKKVGPQSQAEAKDVVTLRSKLEERTRDLQRVTAEYANYRKRVDRDRVVVVEQATGAVLTTLLPVLDDIDRARAHGDLTGAFASVAEQLHNNLTKLGLTAFGEKGDTFDPTWHEAVAHSTSPDVTEPTCVEVLRRGYALGDRLLRAAMVAVAEPAEPGTVAAEGAAAAVGAETGASPAESATGDGEGASGPGASDN